MVKRNKEQRCEIRHNGLSYKSEVTRQFRFAIVFYMSHNNKVGCFTKFLA
jgi:hypothetical protein